MTRVSRGLAGKRVGATFVRDADAGKYLESFLVCAVGTVLVVRFYLELTGYPQIGGGGLHIAHILWGGLGMLIALVLLFGFIGRRVHHLAAIAGGIGFGLFIDELGKFITSDNNYLFQPTIALLYVIFISIYMAIRTLNRRQVLSQQEYLINAIGALEEAILNNLDRQERDRALAFLEKSEPNNPITGAVANLLHQMELVPTPPPGRLVRVGRALRNFYFKLVDTRWVPVALVAVFLLQVISVIAILFVVILSDQEASSGDLSLGFADWGNLISTAVSSVLVLVGIGRLWSSRLVAYRWFKRGLLISIFLAQFFAFYSEQLAGLIGLIIAVVLLVAVGYMIREEERLADTVPAGRPVAV